MRRMQGWVVGAALAGFTGGMVLVLPQAAVAQIAEGKVWIQIEAKNSRPRIEERLRYWAETLPGVTGFVTTNGWYAAALGPFNREEAAETLNELRLLRAIPSDSFIAEDRVYRGVLDAGAVRPGVEAAGAATGLPPISGAEGAPAGVVDVTPLPPAGGGAGGLAGGASAAVEETPAEARRLEGLLSRDERMDIQRALLWAGQLLGSVDGAFGPATRSAISAWQESTRRAPTGVLTTSERQLLVGGWQAEVAALGLETVRDEEAGIELDLPLGLIVFDEYAPPFAHYLAKGDSGVQISLISQPGDQAALRDLYTRLQAAGLIPDEGRGGLGPRGFSVSGSAGGVDTHAWAELSRGVIKGYVMSARSTDAARSQRVLKALQSSFRSLEGQVLDPGLVPLDDSVKAAMMTGVEKRGPKRAGSGFYASDLGHVVTAASVVEACGRITLDGGVTARVLAADAGAGAALLRPEADIAPKSVARFGTSLPRPGSEVAVAGYSFGADLALPSMTFGRFEAPTALDGAADRARLSLSAMAGDVGGPVIGEDGLVLGVLQAPPQQPGRELPASVAYLAPSAGILAALGAAAPALRAASGPEGAMAVEDLSRIGNEMAVQVLCWD